MAGSSSGPDERDDAGRQSLAAPHAAVIAQFRELRATGEETLREEIVVAHLGLVRALASRFKRPGELVDDLVQSGSVALLKAVDGFDPDLGYPFASYAAATIIGELKRHRRDRGWDVRPPRRLQELFLELAQHAEAITHEQGRPPTVHELAVESGVPERDVIEALAAGGGYRAESLDAPAPGADTGPTLGESIGKPDPGINAVDDRLFVKGTLERLSEADRRLIELRFFEGLSQEEIGARIGVSQMQVSRLLARALRRMREQELQAADAESDAEGVSSPPAPDGGGSTRPAGGTRK